MSDVAVVWVALGTPDTPTPPAVKRYLREFLTDRRIIEMNPLAWRLILELFILPRRSKVSAGKYASVWYEAGSPLLVNTRAQAEALQAQLAAQGIEVEVAFAMRYGRPALADVLDDLRRRGIRRILIAPAYPHYSQTTVGSTYDAVAAYIKSHRDQPEWRFIRSFPDHPPYIEALARSIERSWEKTGRPDFEHGDLLLLSYHGIPVAMAEAGDPYPGECRRTTEALRARLGLDETSCRMTFQSKFGPAPWLTPATIDTVGQLGRDGVRRLDVACPTFVADCLETLEEINILNRETFMEATDHQGVFNLVPCLNEDPGFIEALAGVVGEGLAGWV